jgi:ribosomal protein S18 acetylase RimI-like enzyme
MASLEKPLYTSLPNISIEILDCIEDAELIEEYKGYATEQEDNYEGQHPWNSCKKGDTLYIVLSVYPPETLILGWMKVEIEKYDPLHVGFILNFATAKRAYKGIGTYMMDFVEKDLKEKGIHFIELSPLSGAIGFYKKIGYFELAGEQYYKWISDDTEGQFEIELTAYKESIQQELDEE